jgi:6-phosphogluconolactonase
VNGSATRLYIGGYTASSGGTGPGITVFDRDTVESPWRAVQVVEVDDPSFLAVTDGAVHAVSETNEGRLLSFTVSAGSLVAASQAATGGAAPCHVVVDPASGALVVANYTDGTLAVLSADASDPARVARVVALPVGRGPVVDRQERPHAHQVTPTPWGTVLISDLGTDRLLEYRIDPVTLEPELRGTHPMPSGAGPRHVAWLGDRLVVTGELDGRLHVLTHGERGFRIDHSVAAYDTATPGAGALLSHVDVQGSRVYVAVRGRDTISVLQESAATPGRLALVAEVPSGGRGPRHFALTPGAIYVANQDSGTVSVLPLDPETGVPGAATLQIESGSPACVVLV